MNMSREGIDESQLVHGLQTGNRKAYADLYDSYGNNLFNLILELVGSESDAEHLLQETFVKIWRKIRQYDASKGRLYTWLIVIARRTAMDFLRSRYFKERKMIQTEDSAVDIRSQDQEMRRLEFLGVDIALKQLDPDLFHIIELQYFKGYTQQEVAEETGIPLGTVKSRTRTALLNLQKKLKINP